MNLVKDYNFTPPVETLSESNDNGNYQINSSLTNSKTLDFFEYLYSYPPKFTIKWNSVDELNQDLFLENNYGVLEHSFPFIDFIENVLFQEKNQTTIVQNYSVNEFVQGYLNKLYSSKFYHKKTKALQEALSAVPVFVILNGNKEIILSKPINPTRSTPNNRPLDQLQYNYCGSFDPLVNTNPKLGFFFFNQTDAEAYLREVAKSDIEGTNTLGLVIHCIGLNSAYGITREHHPDVDFRFVPDYEEVQTLLTSKLNNSQLVVEDGQQQLRFRPRSANFLPYLGKLGRWLLPGRSFLQKNEYFKGVPIFIVQTTKEKRNLALDQCYKTIDKIDYAWGRILQFYDSFLGFGHNWIMQGSLKDTPTDSQYTNYVFFDESDAMNFVKKQGRKVNRFDGSRTSNVEFLVRKPKVFVYNFEDFLELWEEQLLTNSKNESDKTTFDAKNTFFIPSKKLNQEVTNDPSWQVIKGYNVNTTGNMEYITDDENSLETFTETVNLRFRLFKRYLGFLFSVGYT
jgi:hypothetical protein